VENLDNKEFNKKEKLIFNVDSKKLKKLKFISLNIKIRGIISVILLAFVILYTLVIAPLLCLECFVWVIILVIFSPAVVLIIIILIIEIIVIHILVNISMNKFLFGRKIQKILKNKKEINYENAEYLIENQLKTSKLKTWNYYVIIIGACIFFGYYFLFILFIK
jgi:hypothetical protein